MANNRENLPLEEIIKYWNDGLSISEIGRIYGVSYATIKRRLVEVGIYEKDPKRTVASRERNTLEKYGVKNISSLDSIKKQKEETCLKHFGVPHHNQSFEGKEKRKETSRKKYGTDSPNQSDIVKEHKRQSAEKKYGRNSYTQTHFSDEVFEIISSKERFCQYIQDNCITNTVELSFSLGVSTIKLNRLIKEYECRDLISKNSSFAEIEIGNFLRENELEGRRDRKAIHPKEIDYYVSSINFGVEFNGAFWHSTKYKPIGYHQEKSLLARKNGVFIYNVYSWDWFTPEKKEKTKREILDIINGLCYNVYIEKTLDFFKQTDQDKLSFEIDIGKMPIWFFQKCGFKREKILEPEPHDILLYHSVVKNVDPNNSANLEKAKSYTVTVYDNGKEIWSLDKKEIDINEIENFVKKFLDKVGDNK